MKLRKLLPAFLACLSLGLVVSAAQRGGFRRLGLSEEARAALIEALAGPEGEYAAHAQYSAVIEKFGEVQPYVNIRMAESHHMAALERQFEKYGIPIPENKYEGAVQAPETLLAAAKAGVAAEERNVAMYDEALKKVTKNGDLVRVFTHLRGASEDGHLPAFKAAVESGGKLNQAAGGCCMGACGGPGSGGASGGCCMRGGGPAGRTTN